MTPEQEEDWNQTLCRYCFVPASTRTTPEAFLEPYPRKDALRLLERDAEELADAGDTREILRIMRL